MGQEAQAVSLKLVVNKFNQILTTVHESKVSAPIILIHFLIALTKYVSMCIQLQQVEYVQAEPGTLSVNYYGYLQH